MYYLGLLQAFYGDVLQLSRPQEDYLLEIVFLFPSIPKHSDHSFTLQDLNLSPPPFEMVKDKDPGPRSVAVLDSDCLFRGTHC